jgi:hypothetical protein
VISERITITGDLDDVQRWFEERGLTDGLPIVPPTEERVAAMVAAVPEEASDSLGTLPPRWAEATIEKLAVNAVLAGCRPEVFPVVAAAVRAMLRQEFNLYGLQATTHPVAPMVAVHGPVARRLGVQGGPGALGPGHTANATIGRAVRLILLNVGGAYPGEGDRATHGTPAKFAYCLTENVAESPWPEFHVTRGFDGDQSAVTVFGGEAPHNINDHESTTPERLLDIVADVMAGLGHNDWFVSEDGRNDMVVVLGPEHAALLGRAGWSRSDAQGYLHRRAARPVAELRRGGMWDMRDWPEDTPLEGGATFPAVRRAEDILLLVAGGPGKHSLVIPSFGGTRSVTVAVEDGPTGDG